MNFPQSNGGGGGGTVEENDDSEVYISEDLFCYLSDRERAAIMKEVATTINNELLRPENLEIIVSRLLRSCTNEAKELRRAINSIASTQLLEGNRAVQILKESGERIYDLKALFMKQGELITSMDVTSGSYKQLRQLHFLRENIKSIISWAEALKEVRDTNLSIFIAQRRFAEVYKRLCHLQMIRQTVLERIGVMHRQYQGAFDPYFEKLDAVLIMFAAEVYKFLEQKSVDLAIHMALEEVPVSGSFADNFQEFTQLEECVRVCGDEIAEEGDGSNSGGGGGGGGLCTADGEPLITEAKVCDAVRKCVSQFWEEHVMTEVTSPFAQIPACLKQMKKVAPLLAALEITLIPLSTRFSFFGLFVAAIHGEVIGVLNGYKEAFAELEATSLLEASDFVRWYKETVTEANYAEYIDVDGLDSLCASMITAAVGGLSSHLTNLCRACAISVGCGRGEPTALPGGVPGTTGPIDMFAVLQQSLAGLSTSIELSVMRQIGTACAEAITAYLEECKLRSDCDYWEEENEALGVPTEEWKLRRLAFLYAYTNDCSSIERNMDTVELKFVYCWNSEDGNEIISPFQKVQDLIVEHIRFYVDEIVQHVECVVNTQWKLVFGSKEWHDNENNPTRVIIDTMSDFIDEEFMIALEEPSVRIAIREMMMRYLCNYITRLMEFLGDAIRHPKNQNVKDWNTFLDCFARDTTLAMNMWSERVMDGRGQLVKTARNLLEVVARLMSVRKPVDFNYIVQNDLLEDFGDCPSFVIRFMLQARGPDLEQDLRDRMLLSWDELVAHQRRGSDDVPTAGWSRPPSILGLLDRSLAGLDKKGNFFFQSGHKSRVNAEKQRKKNERQNKKQARRARKEAETVDPTKNEMSLSKKPLKRDAEVEVVNLADVLKL